VVMKRGRDVGRVVLKICDQGGIEVDATLSSLVPSGTCFCVCAFGLIDQIQEDFHANNFNSGT
jgi:hypothetical protein